MLRITWFQEVRPFKIEINTSKTTRRDALVKPEAASPVLVV